MPEQKGWKQRVEPRIADQVDYILTKFHGAGKDIGLVTAQGGVGFMYAEGHLLVRAEYIQRVKDILQIHEPAAMTAHPAT